MTTNKTTALLELYREVVAAQGPRFVASIILKEALAAFEQPSVSEGELLPCPFCGGKGSSEGFDGGNVGCINAECPAGEVNCSAKAWNTRAAFEQSAVDERIINKAIATYDPCFRTSIGEQPAVREMSVDEVAIHLFDAEDSWWGDLEAGDTSHKRMAKALAKLGAIRVVEG